MTQRRTSQPGQRPGPQPEAWRGVLTAGPGILWVTLFLLLPIAGVLGMSFASHGTYGEIEWRWTLENYRRFLGFGLFGFDPVYVRILVRSLAMATGTTLLCAAAALPLTFFIARLRGLNRHLGLMLVIIPFWTNMLIRTYAWQILFAGTGWLARAAAALGFIPPGEGLFPGGGAVFVVLACDFLPFLALPLYASVEKVDWSLAEAASDLGAGPASVFRHALLPQIRPGLMAGSILVFIGAMGQFVIPDLMGGAKTVLLGNAIQKQFGFSRDWPFGSAIASLSMLIVLAGLWLFGRTAGEEGRRTLL